MKGKYEQSKELWEKKPLIKGKRGWEDKRGGGNKDEKGTQKKKKTEYIIFNNKFFKFVIGV